MRCLYCGKGLALLKRLRGGGEFCSDAHRLQYQEEYNQLALSRLIQAQPPEEPAKPAALPNAPAANGQNVPASQGAARAMEPPKAHPPAPQKPAVRPAATAKPITAAPRSTPAATLEPEPVPKPEVKPPAPMAWFVRDLPHAADGEGAAPDMAGLQLLIVAQPALPGREETISPKRPDPAEAAAEGAPPHASRIPLPVPAPVLGTPFPIRAGNVEVRESGRSTPIAVPVAALHLHTYGPVGGIDAPSGEDGSSMQWSLRERPMDFRIWPTPPGDAGSVWLGGAQEFTAPPIELGDLARLSLAVEALPDTETFDAALVVPEPPRPATRTETPDPGHAPAAPISIEPRRHVSSPTPRTVIEPVHPPQVQIDPAFLKAFTAREPLQAEPAPAVAQPQPEDSTPAPEPASAVPERVTRPLPLTLHGFPPARGKGAQIFTSGLRTTPEIQITNTSALPLRPVMLFAPAPSLAEPAVVPPPDAVKTRRAEPELPPPADIETQEARAEPKPEPKPELAPEAKTEPKPERKKAEAKPEPKAKAKSEFPAPLAAPITSLDLGLPSLQMDAVGKSRTSPVVIAVVLVVVGIIGVAVYKLGGKTTAPSATATAPVSDVIETGTPLSVAEAGWIDDWAPQPPNPKVLRVLSMLRGSMPLSDYRMEFEAQIESKALGWVFRALNAKNYYVTKLEVVKPGLEPTMDVVHFAMIDGEEQTRARTPLPFKVRVDTQYKVRFEALGDRFTTYVQDQKVEEWNDNRIGRGGAGLYRERGESAQLKGTVRMVLIAKKK